MYLGFFGLVSTLFPLTKEISLNLLDYHNHKHHGHNNPWTANLSTQIDLSIC